MRILYFNNCWFTNVGEAFIDIGAVTLLHRIFADADIINISTMNWDYVKYSAGKNPSYEYKNRKMLEMYQYFSGDYVIYPGMFASDEFMQGTPGYHMLLSLVKKGVRPVFLGLGQALYSEKETERFAALIRKLEPALIVSRDDTVYRHFKDYAPAVKGIDCAFWVKDIYDPRCVTDKKYDAVSYNRSSEPENIGGGCEEEKRDVLRAWHFPYGFAIESIRDNLLLSDSPYDYLTLYANAEKVYTDLVHASIAALQYGRHVRFDRVDNRGYAIDAVENMKKDGEGLLYVEEADLERQKKRIEKEIREILF